MINGIKTMHTGTMDRGFTVN